MRIVHCFAESLALSLLVISTLWGQQSQKDHGWDVYGDRYQVGARLHADVSNFFILEGPGNGNPDNFQNLPQGDPNLRIPPELKTYIARQFKYVLFDQESFADRNGVIPSLLTSVYHQEAESLMNRNPNLIVLPYFSFTVIRNDYPWMQKIDTNWILRDPANPSVRIRANEQGLYLMDIRNPAWRSYYINYLRDTVNRYNYRGVFLDNVTGYQWLTPSQQVPGTTVNSRNPTVATDYVTDNSGGTSDPYRMYISWEEIGTSGGIRFHRANMSQLPTNPTDFSHIRWWGGASNPGTNTTNETNFKPTLGGVAIRTDFLDGPGVTNGNVQFSDPWYIDYNDPAYGNNRRNQGHPGALHSRSSPFNPGYDNPFPEGTYNGVFLNENGQFDPNKPYYSVGALATQTIGRVKKFF